jgi:8-oxo-dGTP pyrophosphatase MutT (NUDIX family)
MLESTEVQNATLCFLIRPHKQDIREICLALKKRGFGEGLWNGVGGKVDHSSGESVEAALRREAKEEIGVVVDEVEKVAELSFVFPHKAKWNQLVHAYICPSWQGEPIESEEMAPKWYLTEDIPWDKMWPDDRLWVPHIIKGEKVRAVFELGADQQLKGQSIEIVSEF